MSQPTTKNTEATALRSILKGSTQYRAKTTEPTPNHTKSSRSYIYPGRTNDWLDGAYERLLNARANEATTTANHEHTAAVTITADPTKQIESPPSRATIDLTSAGNYTTTRQATPDSISDTLSPSVFGRKTAARFQAPSSFTRSEDATPPSSPLYPALPDASPTHKDSGVSYPKLPIEGEGGAASPLRVFQVKGGK